MGGSERKIRKRGRIDFAGYNLKLYMYNKGLNTKLT